METFNKLYAAANNQKLWKIVLIAFLVWFVLRLLCWILGAVGIGTVGKNTRHRPYWMAWVPFGQLWYEIRLTHHLRAARRAKPLLCWHIASCTAAAAALIWAINGVLSGSGTTDIKILLAAALAAAVGALYCLIRLRVLEFYSLRDYMDNLRLWTVCLIFTILGVPIQKLFFYFNRTTLN